MPAARANVSFDLSALSTSVAKRTGADDASLPDAEMEMFYVGRNEYEALLRQVAEQEEKIRMQKLHNEHLHSVNKALEKALKKCMEERNFMEDAFWQNRGKEGASERSEDAARRWDETEKAGSSASGGGDDGQDAVPVPPPQPAPAPAQPAPAPAPALPSPAPAQGFWADEMDEGLDDPTTEPTLPLLTVAQGGGPVVAELRAIRAAKEAKQQRKAYEKQIQRMLKIANGLEDQLKNTSLRQEHAQLYDQMINRALRALADPDVATSELKLLAEWLEEDVSQLNDDFRSLEEMMDRDGIDKGTGERKNRR